MKTYGVLTLTESSPAQSFSEPLTLTEVKKFLNLPERSPIDGEEDLLLENFIIGARETAEILQGQDLIRKQYDLWLDYFPYEIELNRPLVSVDLVEYRNSDGNYTTLVNATDFDVDIRRGLVFPKYGQTWPSFTGWPSGAVLIRFTCGYSATHPFWSNAGQRLLVGMKHLISAWYNNRLPFEIGNSEGMNEYSYTVSALLGYGSVPRIG